MFRHLCLLCVFVLVCENEAARILAYYPLPFISHQVVFRPLSLELAKRGHDVIVMTPDPMFPKGGGPKNLKEIDLHELSYTAWNNALKKINANFDSTHFSFIARVTSGIIEDQLKSVEVQKLLTNKSESFDLVIVEAFAEQGLGLAHHFKTPVIQFSSMGVIVESYKIYGAPIHPFLYPTPFYDRVFNLTILEKLHELYKQYDFQQVIPRNLELYDDMLKRVFGPDVPKFVELREDVDLLFLNVHASWDFNRPVPPNIIYLGGMHQKPKEDLPEDLKKYLDSSKNGVIYVSFGTNVDPALFPPEKIQALVKVFSKLPYDILWKWNHDELPGRTENIRISKWLPQSDLLRHPKVKLFVTQGGLQSTDEAITAEIPLLGIPIYADQNFNVELYLHYKLGERVELESLNEDTLSKAIDKLLTDDSYRRNVAKLHAIMTDQPQTPLERAVWWTEYVIRHKGAKHLRSPAAGMSLTEYFEVELIAYLVLGLLLVVSVVCYLVIFVCSCLFGRKEKVKKN